MGVASTSLVAVAVALPPNNGLATIQLIVAINNTPTAKIRIQKRARFFIAHSLFPNSTYCVPGLINDAVYYFSIGGSTTRLEND